MAKQSSLDILKKTVLSEGDVRLLMRRINAGDREVQNALWNFPPERSGGSGWLLSREQVEKGKAWLNKHWRDMGYRELAVMDNFEDIWLIGTAPGEYNNYQYPYYRVVSYPDAESYRSHFDYKVEGGKLFILG
jgi:hypothetical protein